jgi:hypothetical protein
LRDGDRVAVYPAFRFDTGSPVRARRATMSRGSSPIAISAGWRRTCACWVDVLWQRQPSDAELRAPPPTSGILLTRSDCCCPRSRTGCSRATELQEQLRRWSNGCTRAPRSAVHAMPALQRHWKVELAGRERVASQGAGARPRGTPLRRLREALLGRHPPRPDERIHRARARASVALRRSMSLWQVPRRGCPGSPALGAALALASA